MFTFKTNYIYMGEFFLTSVSSRTASLVLAIYQTPLISQYDLSFLSF